LNFTVTITNDVGDGPIPDGFAFYILDNSGRPIPTVSPGSDYLIALTLGVSGGVPLAFGSDVSRAPSVGDPISIPAPTLTLADAIPPTTTAIVSPLPNGAGWNNSDLTITLISVDSPDGSGVEQIVYSATGAQSITSTVVPGATTPFPISTEGISTATFFGTDNAGNVEAAKTLTIKLDKTPPTIFGTATPPANANGWNNTNVAFSFQCADPLSGLAAGSPPAPTILSADGAAQAVTGTCQDLAGNASSAVVSGIKIDQTPPAVGITAPVNGATYKANQTVSAAYNCVDNTSGLATCAGTVPNGGKIDTAPAGTLTTKTFKVTGMDVAGNAASQTVNYQVSCDYLALGISPAIVSRGSIVKVTGTAMSCTNAAQIVSVKFTLTGPLGPKSCSNTSTVMFTTPPFTIRAGTSEKVSFPFFIPKTACTGTFTTTATTLIRGVSVDSSSATLRVQ
jgi:hypothetical protein